MLHNIDAGEPKDLLDISDLNYEHPGKKYTCKFSYLGQGILFLYSKGYADETSLRLQFKLGDEARLRLKVAFPDIVCHLIWDISELQGISILARYELMLRAMAPESYASIYAVGSNNMTRSFIKVLKIISPNLKLFFIKNMEDAIQSIRRNVPTLQPSAIPPEIPVLQDIDRYARFIDLWQKNPNYIQIGQYKLKILNADSWYFESAEKNFKASLSIIEGNIFRCCIEGHIKAHHIEWIYHQLADIIHLFGFNASTFKFYSIIDLQKVKGITLNARRLTNHYEQLNMGKTHIVVMLPSPILLFALKVQKRINPASFGHWVFQPGLEDAFEIIRNHKKGITETIESQIHPETSLQIPDNTEDLIAMVKKLHKENKQIKHDQQEHIQKILEITGRMTWDESFSESWEIKSDSSTPFVDVYNALTVIKDDFHEILKEKVFHVQKLKESEDKYWNLINMANDIILVYHEQTCKLVNSRVFDVLGYTPEEFRLKIYSELLDESEILRLRADFKEKALNTPWYFETVLRHKKGYQVPVSISMGSVIYEDLQAELYIIRDITAKKIAEAELNKYRNHLEELVAERTRQLEKETQERVSAENSDRLKSAFLSNMSHEIRTPMNAIIAFSDFLRNPELSESRKDEYINYIQSSGQSLLNLINDIIDISKIEARQISLQKTNCFINSILEELFILFETTRKTKKCEGLQLILDRRNFIDNLVLKTDPYRLKQILSNLLDNAFKFTETGTIRFGYEVKKDILEFFVKDSGVGIAKEKQEYIFQRFGKIETAGKNKGGTGLGLAISQNLAIILGGNLRVESVLNQGSIFYVQIPYRWEHEQPKPDRRDNLAEKKDYDWTGKKILIAEDEELNFKVLQIGLQKTNITMIRAENGQEAVKKYKEHPDIELVLMDIQMPEMDGYEALAILKSLNHHLPVVAQTAFAMVEEKENCLRKGFDDYISKPINLNELISKIGRLLDKETE